MLAVAWLFFERVKHLLGSTTVTGGTMGGAALCKQALIAKPLSGLCVGFCVVFFITATHYVTRCSLAIFFMPHVCMKPSFPVKALFVPVLFFFFSWNLLILHRFFPASVPLRSFSPSSNPLPPCFLCLPLCSTLSFLFLPLSPSPPSLPLTGDWLGNLAGCQQCPLPCSGEGEKQGRHDDMQE